MHATEASANYTVHCLSVCGREWNGETKGFCENLDRSQWNGAVGDRSVSKTLFWEEDLCLKKKRIYLDIH